MKAAIQFKNVNKKYDFVQKYITELRNFSIDVEE